MLKILWCLNQSTNFSKMSRDTCQLPPKGKNQSPRLPENNQGTLNVLSPPFERIQGRRRKRKKRKKKREGGRK